MAQFAVVHTNSETGFVEVKTSESILAAVDWAIGQVGSTVENEFDETFEPDHEGDDYGVDIYSLESGHVSRCWCGYDEYLIVKCSYI